jgi:hypothetical protein
MELVLRISCNVRSYSLSQFHDFLDNTRPTTSCIEIKPPIWTAMLGFRYFKYVVCTWKKQIYVRSSTIRTGGHHGNNTRCVLLQHFSSSMHLSSAFSMQLPMLHPRLLSCLRYPMPQAVQQTQAGQKQGITDSTAAQNMR